MFYIHELVFFSSCFCDLGPVTALAGVPVDESRLAVVKVGVSLEALEIGVFFSWVLIQPIRTAMAEVTRRVSSCGRGWSLGRFWANTYIMEH